MEEEDAKMFDLKNDTNPVLDSQLLGLKDDAEEEIVGLDVVDFEKKKWAYEFDINQKVGEFLELVLQDLGIDAKNSKINFAFKSTILDNNRTLKSYNVQSTDVLYLCRDEIKLNSEVGAQIDSIYEIEQVSGIISVIIGDSNNKMEKFDIKETATVKELIDMYQGSFHLQNKATVFLIHKGKILNQNQTLKECGVGNFSRLNILIRLPGGW